MSETILLTKLFIPPLRPSLVARPRLVQRLREAAAARLILVSAPAGFGKTTLVTSWLAQEERPTAWLSLDESDNTPGRFFVYLLTAIQTVYPDLGQKMLSALNSSRPPADEVVVPALINDLALYDQPLILVLDDYHEIKNETIHEALAFFIENMPPGIQLVLTSRKDPPLPLPRWRARGQVLEIGAADLRFRGGEVPDFLRQTMGLDLAETAVQELAQRTEGWVAGLQLAALTLRESEDGQNFIQEFGGSDRQIADYLLQEVLLHQPEELQRFMQRTSILERFCAPLCDTLLDQDDSQSILEQLDQANLFLIPLDNERYWYRYHHLFAQLLRQRLQRSLETKALQALHLRAAQWYASNDLREEAIDQTLQIPDYAYAAQLIASFPTHILFEQGGIGLVKGWVKVLPKRILKEHPRAAALAVAAFMLLGDAQKLQEYTALIDGNPSVRAEQALFESIIVRNHSADFQKSMHLAQEALAALADGEPILRAVAQLQIAVNQENLGDLHGAEETLSNMRQWLDKNDPSTVSMFIQVIHMQAGLAMEQADYFQAERLCQDGLAFADEREDQRAWPFAALMQAGLAAIYYQWNDQEQTETYLEAALDWGQRTAISDIIIQGHLVRANLAAVRGQRDQVNESLGVLRGVTDDSWMIYIQEQVQVLIAYYDWRLGDQEQAVRWANASGLSLVDHVTLANYFKYQTLGQIRLDEARVGGQKDEARSVADMAQRLIDKLPHGAYRFVALQFIMLKALALDCLGDGPSAKIALAEALDLAKPGSLIRVFLDWGAPMRDLLQTAVHLDPLFVGQLLRAFEQERGLEPNIDQSAHPAKASSIHLTPREQEILGLIAAGLSNKEIEQRLVISKNTVRTHIKNLYSKLDASSRTQAVIKGQELRLI